STEFRALALTLRAREGAFNNRRPREFSEAQMNDHKITSMYEVLGALEETLKAADPDKRKKLAQTLDAYHDDFPEDFLWATGAPITITRVRERSIDWDEPWSKVLVYEFETADIVWCRDAALAPLCQ